MSFVSVLTDKLLNDIGPAALCPQIYPQQPKQNISAPFAWFTFIRDDAYVFGHSATGISNYIFEFTALADSQEEVTAICDKVTQILNNYVSLPDVGSLDGLQEAQATRATDGYVYYVKSLRFKGIGI